MTPVPSDQKTFAGLPGVTLVQIGMLLCLVAGGVLHLPVLSWAAAGLAVLVSALQWRRLLPLARVFGVLALLAGGLVALLLPEALPQLLRALVQGTAFAALLMVLGLLRQPVRRATITREAAGHLLSFAPRTRFSALQSGAHFMSLMFNVGIIPMIGDLTQPQDGRDMRADPARRAMVLAAMRGAAMVTIWSPIGLGMAVVTSGVVGLDPLHLVVAGFGLTAVALVITGRWPLLPTVASVPAGAMPRGAETGGSGRALGATFAVAGLLLALAIAVHRGLEISFTLASVILLPAFSFVWILLENRRTYGAPGARLRQSLMAMADLRSESLIFMAANVIGATLSILIQVSPLWPLIAQGGLPGWPMLMAGLVLIPLAAMCYLPNSVVVVMAAQVLGPTLLGQSHPVALGLMLTVGWSTAIAVSPISAMALMTAALCGVSPRRVAWRWNLPFVLLLTGLAALAVSGLYATGF